MDAPFTSCDPGHISGAHHQLWTTAHKRSENFCSTRRRSPLCSLALAMERARARRSGPNGWAPQRKTGQTGSPPLSCLFFVAAPRDLNNRTQQTASLLQLSARSARCRSCERCLPCRCMRGKRAFIVWETAPLCLRTVCDLQVLAHKGAAFLRTMADALFKGVDKRMREEQMTKAYAQPT